MSAVPHWNKNVDVVLSALLGPLVLLTPDCRVQANQCPADDRTDLSTTNLRTAIPARTGTNHSAATGSVPTTEKPFHWRASWDGWNGFYLEFTGKTPIGALLPGTTNLEHFNVTQRIDQKLFGRSLAPGTNSYGASFGQSKLSARIGGKLAVDGAAYLTGKQFTDFDDGFQLRRARLYAKGDCLLVFPVSYEIEVGYVPHEFYIERSYLAWKDVGLFGEVKLGQYQAPMSLEAVTSSRDVTFMELAAPVQALAPGVDAGGQAGRPLFQQRMTLTTGLFAQGVGRDYGDASENYARVIARVTGLLLDASDPAQPGSGSLLHLGLSANVLYSANSYVRYQTRPESRLAPYVVDTGVIEANGALVAGAEAAWVGGPFSAQAEYLHSSVREDSGQIVNFDGVYASLSWFLTGESRPYDRQIGCFTRVVPRHNFNWGRGGWGAWEFATRYSFLDLDSQNIQGGRLWMLTAGVNWYLHPHIKWRFDYGFGRVTDHQPAGNLNIFQTRIEVDF